jgi:hypothetical protein
MFSIFFIVYCVLAFFTAIHNMEQVFKELQKHDAEIRLNSRRRSSLEDIGLSSQLNGASHGNGNTSRDNSSSNINNNNAPQAPASPSTLSKSEMILRQLSGHFFKPSPATLLDDDESSNNHNNNNGYYRSGREIIDSKDFIIQCLLTTGKIDQRDLDPILQVFNLCGLIVLHSIERNV